MQPRINFILHKLIEIATLQKKVAEKFEKCQNFSLMEFERIQRLPSYILGVVTHLMMEARKRGEDIINLGMGNPDLPTPPHIVNKLIEAAQKPINHRYSMSRGIPKLRKAISDWYARHYNISLDPEHETIRSERGD